VLEYQSRGAQILVCGDFDAGTTEEPDILKAELQPFLPTEPDDDELPAFRLGTTVILLQGPKPGVQSYWGFANKIISFF